MRHCGYGLGKVLSFHASINIDTTTGVIQAEDRIVFKIKNISTNNL